MNPSEHLLALWPPAASASAAETDHLILAFTVLTLVLTVPIFLSITWFAIWFRAGRQVHRDYQDKNDRRLEISWMLIPFLLTLVFFYWGARMFDTHKHPPSNSIEISAIGKQWMWKFQHPGGQAEINDLHVPTGQPVVINMISQDVIHALFLPALRIQMETLPGRYTQLWFKADRPGVYRLFCSEYCGTDHSKMAGLLTIMTPADYQRWLGQSSTSGSLVAQGKAAFTARGCAGCHVGQSVVRAPSLAGLFNNPVPLEDGSTIIADDGYLRDKILDPDRNKIAGFKQVMPSFKGLVGEGEMIALVSYIKSLGLASPGTTSSTQTGAAP